MTDEQLVALALAGDTSAFDDLVLRHQGAVYRLALVALRNHHEAEEVTQDAFVRAWTGLRGFRGDASFKTWLLTIAWRRATTRRRVTFGWWNRTTAIDAEPRALSLADPGHRPDELILTQEARELVAVAIRALSPKLRDALLLVNTGDCGYGEIAAVLGIPEGTLKWRVSEARRKVKAHLVAQGGLDARSTRSTLRPRDR